MKGGCEADEVRHAPLRALGPRQRPTTNPPNGYREPHGQFVCLVCGAEAAVTATAPRGETTVATHAPARCCRVSAGGLMALVTKTAVAHFFLLA